MDYSKLTLKQLLGLLKQNAPRLSNDMTNMYSGKIYPDEYPNILNSIRKGYDVGLMEDTYSDVVSKFYDPETGEPEFAGVVPADLINSWYHVPGEKNPFSKKFLTNKNDNPLGGGSFAYTNPFPSDNFWRDTPGGILNTSTGKITSFPEYYNPDGTEPPAVASAELFNALTDEDLLNLLPKDDSPLFDFNIYDLVDDYEGNAEAVDRHLKRNKNFRWD